MKAVIVYCSKTGNTEKVAHAIQQGLRETAHLVKLDLSTEGLLQDFTAGFVMDLAPYDLIFLGGWTMIMRVHPFLAAYIQRCGSLEGKNIVGFITGGASFSRSHVRDDFCQLVAGRGARVYDFMYTTTLLGATLTRTKLRIAEQFASDVACRFSRIH